MSRIKDCTDYKKRNYLLLVTGYNVVVARVLKKDLKSTICSFRKMLAIALLDLLSK